MPDFQQLSPPGSNEAIDNGCTCPILSNNNGAGSRLTNNDGEPMYWKSSDCPLHGYGLSSGLLAELAHSSNPDSLVESPDSLDDDQA